MLAYGFEVEEAPRYGVAVEVALQDLSEAVASGRELTDLRRRAEGAGCTAFEIAWAIAAGHRLH